MSEKPVQKFTAGGLNVAVWENENKQGGKYNTISISRNYKDKNDEWKSTNSLRINDIPKAVLALNKAYEHLSLKEETI